MHRSDAGRKMPLRESIGYVTSELTRRGVPDENIRTVIIVLEEILDRLETEGRDYSVELRNRGKTARVTVSFTGDAVDFLAPSSAPEQDEIRAQIQQNILRHYAEHWSVRSSSGQNRVTLRVFSEKKISLSEEVAAYYSRREGDPPGALAQLRALFSAHCGRVLLCLLIKFMRHLPMLAIPVVTANIINMAANPDAFSMRKLWISLGAALLCLGVNVLFSYLDSVVFIAFVRELEFALRDVMADKLHRLSLTFHRREHSGKLSSRILRDVEALGNSLRYAASGYLNAASDVIVALIMTAVLCPVMLLFFVPAIPAAVLLVNAFRKPMKLYNRQFHGEMEQSYIHTGEMLETLELARDMGLRGREKRRMTGFFRSVYRSGSALDILNNTFSSVSNAAITLLKLICLGISAYLAVRGKIEAGTVLLFETYFSMIIDSCMKLLERVPDVAAGVRSAESIAELMCSPDDEKNGDVRLSAHIHKAIEIKDAVYTYEDTGIQALKGLDLRIPAGARIAVTGASGSGKSTLLNLITGAIVPQSGCVMIDGIPLERLEKDHYRRRIAVVPQETVLFAGTLWENLVYGAPYATREEVFETIRAVHLQDVLGMLPNGLDTLMTEHGSLLSGGQRQRIAIARALLRRPELLIMDEATNALDAEAEQNVQTAIDALPERCTVIIVAHRPSTVWGMRSVAVLKDGKIAEYGSCEELIRKNGEFCRLFRIPRGADDE